MMQGRRDKYSTSSPSGSRYPPLAPRDSQARGRSAGSAPGGPSRLSNRSRAGCWTCRGRKVKCDEVHPRCGPCTRLNRECDWDHRWNFSDATSTTQSKHTNVTTTGSAVWDPDVRSTSSASPRPPPQHDNLPAFAALTNDEDRERKAGTRLPGTYSVVVTPESFEQLPEYVAAVFSSSESSSRRMSEQSRRLSAGSPLPALGRSKTIPADPNIIVLDRFEDTISAATSLTIPIIPRRQSFPEDFQELSISVSSAITSTVVPLLPLDPIANPDDHLLLRFRTYIIHRLVQPLTEQTVELLSPGSTRDVFELEATRFPPLHHAICAISALNLSYVGNVSLEEALQHYHQALSTAATPTSPDDLLSDGVFLRHFILFVYDICVPMETDDNMWAQHLNRLRQISVQRHERLGREPHAYILWRICQLDVEACFLGSGTCEFVRTLTEHDIFPAREQLIPVLELTAPGHFLPNETAAFPQIMHLDRGVLIIAAKLAQLAQRCRAEASAQLLVSPETYIRWQTLVSPLQRELLTFWSQSYPEFLGQESPQAGYGLPSRVQFVFEHALILYHASMIYSRTSMFSNQRMVPTAQKVEIHADTERRCACIVALADSYVGSSSFERRHIIFPLLIAGVATTQPDIKVRIIELMKAFQIDGGIGQNTYRTRQLLQEVYEEQRTIVSNGGRLEQVDWLAVAKERGLNVVNCGL